MRASLFFLNRQNNFTDVGKRKHNVVPGTPGTVCRTTQEEMTTQFSKQGVLSKQSIKIGRRTCAQVEKLLYLSTDNSESHLATWSHKYNIIICLLISKFQIILQKKSNYSTVHID